MSRSQRKGHEGELWTQQYLNLWFPDYEESGEGAIIMTSKGGDDDGDIAGIPYTMIEVKNHANPALAALLDNAEWKSVNAGKPVWFLVYKRPGAGRRSVHRWHTVTTVKGFLDAWVPTNVNGEVAFTPEQVSDFCDEWTDIDAAINATFKSKTPSPLPWTLRLMFRPYLSKIEEQRDRAMAEVEPNEQDNRVVPIVIHPRKRQNPDTREWYFDDPQNWYVYTTLQFQARMLETVGILPFDPADYGDAALTETVAPA